MIDFTAESVTPDSGEHIRQLYRRRKVSLVAEVKRWAMIHGREWLIGGPEVWTKDELVRAILNIEEGREP